MRYSLLTLSLCAVLAGCSPQSTEPTNGNQTAVEQSAEQQKLAQLFADYFEASLQLNPLSATYMGDKRFNDQLPNFYSPDYRDKALALEQEYLDKINAIDPTGLSEQQRLSYKIFKREREMEIESAQYPDHLMPINQFYNVTNRIAILGSGQSAQPFDTFDDYQDWATRMEQVPALLDQAIVNMREGVEKEIVQPRVLIEKTIPQIEAHLVDDLEQSIFWKPVLTMPEDFTAEQRAHIEEHYAKVIQESIFPAFSELRDYLANEYMPHTRTDTFGLGQVPGGDAWYAHKVKQRTTTNMTPDEIHQIGLDEVARIHQGMREVMEQTGFEGTLLEFFEFTKTDPQFTYATREEMVEDYRSLRDSVDELAQELFDIFPKADYEVRKVEEFREQSASSGSYQRPSQDGSRPGVFYLNTYDLPARPSWAKTALFLHEAAPGHHFQLALQQELEDLPDFRRFGGETAYIEGWGLYAESLGYDMGLYEQPYQRFGALAAELWRALRLVVDTGIHSKGWSRQQVLDYMYQNAPVAKARAVSEAERFMALPGQALAYKIGQLKIEELRTRAETQLGDDFDIKAFHRQILQDGALPLAILEEKIDAWIAAQL